MGRGWIVGQQKTDGVATIRSSKNVSNEAGEGQKVLINPGQQTLVEKTPSTCHAAGFILQIYEELLP